MSAGCARRSEETTKPEDGCRPDLRRARRWRSRRHQSLLLPSPAGLSLLLRRRRRSEAAAHGNPSRPGIGRRWARHRRLPRTVRLIGLPISFGAGAIAETVPWAGLATGAL